MENLKEMLLDMADTEEQEDFLSDLADKVATKAVKSATKELEKAKGEIITLLDRKISQIPKETPKKGDKGDSPTDEHIVSLIKPLIPRPITIKGDAGYTPVKGKDYRDGEDGQSVKLKDVIEALKPEILPRIHGGGNMNRNISVGGNSSVLSRYTDINWKAGTNVTLTYANNDTTKNVDITITSSGGAGSGIVRSINSVSSPTTAGAVASTDYVYLVSGTTTITLPTAVGNTNLYTIKNVGSGVVTVATTSAQTIDGSTTISLPVQYTSVDVESDTANWNVT